MPAAEIRFQTVAVYEDNGGIFLNLPNAIDADEATAAQVGGVLGSATSILLKDPEIPEDFGSVDTFAFRVDWLFNVGAGRNFQRASIYSREGDGSAWVQRFSEDIGEVESVEAIVIPVTSLPALQILLENYYTNSGGEPPDPPPDVGY